MRMQPIHRLWMHAPGPECNCPELTVWRWVATTTVAPRRSNTHRKLCRSHFKRGTAQALNRALLKVDPWLRYAGPLHAPHAMPHSLDNLATLRTCRSQLRCGSIPILKVCYCNHQLRMQATGQTTVCALPASLMPI